MFTKYVINCTRLILNPKTRDFRHFQYQITTKNDFMLFKEHEFYKFPDLFISCYGDLHLYKKRFVREVSGNKCAGFNCKTFFFFCLLDKTFTNFCFPTFNNYSFKLFLNTACLSPNQSIMHVLHLSLMFFF